MSTDAMVTVVIPTLNRPQLCALAIDSALGQSEAGCRVLVSENHSDAQHTDGYARLFASLPARARVLRQPRRLSVEEHLAWLVSQVDTAYVVLLADDDTLAPTFVARALRLARQCDAGAVFGPYRLEYKTSGRHETRDHDYTHRSRFLRVSRFLLGRDDAFIYGLFRVDVLVPAMAEFRPLQILGRRTLIRIAYAPLFACLLAAPYAHLPGEPVWINTADAPKSEAYLGANKVRKLVELVLGEWVLAGRFLRLARRAGGWPLMIGLAPVVALAGLEHAAGFTVQAVRRFAELARRGGR